MTKEGGYGTYHSNKSARRPLDADHAARTELTSGVREEVVYRDALHLKWNNLSLDVKIRTFLE